MSPVSFYPIIPITAPKYCRFSSRRVSFSFYPGGHCSVSQFWPGGCGNFSPHAASAPARELPPSSVPPALEFSLRAGRHPKSFHYLFVFNSLDELTNVWLVEVCTEALFFPQLALSSSIKATAFRRSVSLRPSKKKL